MHPVNRVQGLVWDCRASQADLWHSGTAATIKRLGRVNDDIFHYSDVIMGATGSKSTSLTIVYSAVYSDADQRKHQGSASLAFVWGIHRWPVNSPHKWPVTRKMFPLDDVIMDCRASQADLWHSGTASTVKRLGRVNDGIFAAIIWQRDWHSILFSQELWDITLRTPEYSGQSRSIPCLLMTWQCCVAGSSTCMILATWVWYVNVDLGTCTVATNSAQMSWNETKYLRLL